MPVLFVRACALCDVMGLRERRLEGKPPYNNAAINFVGRQCPPSLGLSVIFNACRAAWCDKHKRNKNVGRLAPKPPCGHAHVVGSWCMLVAHDTHYYFCLSAHVRFVTSWVCVNGGLRASRPTTTQR